MTVRGICAFSILSMCFLALGCSDKERRLPPGELNAYKLELVRANDGQITPEQKVWIMQHPGRTESELDAAVQTFRSQFQSQVDRERTEVDIRTPEPNSGVEILSGSGSSEN